MASVACAGKDGKIFGLRAQIEASEKTSQDKISALENSVAAAEAKATDFQRDCDSNMERILKIGGNLIAVHKINVWKKKAAQHESEVAKLQDAVLSLKGRVERAEQGDGGTACSHQSQRPAAALQSKNPRDGGQQGRAARAGQQRPPTPHR